MSLQGALNWVVRKLADLQGGDETEGQPDVAEGVAALHAKDWTALNALYANRSPSDRYHFLQGVANVCKLECETPPAGSAELASITVGLYVGWAWRHRGYGVGSTVTESGARNMWRLLEQTVRLVDELGARADSVALACAIRATMALDGSRGDLQRYLNAAEKLGELNIFVPRNHLWFVAPKWHGSIEEIHAIAREYAAKPASPAWLSLPAMAYAEEIVFRLHMSDASTSERLSARRAYATGAEYGAELERLDDAFWRAREHASVDMGHAETTFAHNAFAYLMYRRGMKERLARHLTVIGPHLLTQPWGYDGLARPSLRALRRRAGLPLW